MVDNDGCRYIGKKRTMRDEHHIDKHLQVQKLHFSKLREIDMKPSDIFP